MNVARAKGPSGATLAGSSVKEISGSASRSVPPILVLRNDDTRLHVFNTIDELVDHHKGSAVDTRSWDVFDSKAAELEVVNGQSGIIGVTAKGSKVRRDQLLDRLHLVMDRVEARIQENPPEPDMGIDVSVINKLRRMPYGRLLQELAELFSGASDQLSAGPERPSPPAKQIRATGPAVATVTAAGGAGQQPTRGHRGSTTIVAKNDPDPHSADWWHNTFGH